MLLYSRGSIICFYIFNFLYCKGTKHKVQQTTTAVVLYILVCTVSELPEMPWMWSWVFFQKRLCHSIPHLNNLRPRRTQNKKGKTWLNCVRSVLKLEVMVRDVTFTKHARRGWPIATHWSSQSGQSEPIELFRRRGFYKLLQPCKICENNLF